MTVSEDNPTPEQLAACERAMDGLEAQADIWADEVDLVLMVKILGKVARGLNDRMPKDVREGFINRLEAQIDAIARQAYLEGFMRGGDSRKDYEDAKRTALTAALSDQVVVPEDDWRTDIENAPKDGSEVLLPLEFKARAFWCADLKTWVLSYPFSVNTISRPKRFQIPKFPRAMLKAAPASTSGEGK